MNKIYGPIITIIGAAIIVYAATEFNEYLGRIILGLMFMLFGLMIATEKENAKSHK